MTNPEMWQCFYVNDRTPWASLQWAVMKLRPELPMPSLFQHCNAPRTGNKNEHIHLAGIFLKLLRSFWDPKLEKELSLGVTTGADAPLWDNSAGKAGMAAGRRSRSHSTAFRSTAARQSAAQGLQLCRKQARHAGVGAGGGQQSNWPPCLNDGHLVPKVVVSLLQPWIFLHEVLVPGTLLLQLFLHQEIFLDRVLGKFIWKASTRSCMFLSQWTPRPCIDSCFLINLLFKGCP